MIRKLFPGLVVLVFVLTCIPAARADGTGTVGCGPGSTSIVTTCTGTISQVGNVFSTSTPTDVSLTGFTCASHCGFLNIAPIAEELTVNNERWQFSFSATNGGGGTFKFTDTDGVLGSPDFALSGDVTLLTVTSGSTPGSSILKLDVNPTLVGFGFDDGAGPAGLHTSNVSGYSGSITITDPDAAITGLTGSVNYTRIPTEVAVPDPGTLVLLGAGLLGLPFLRRQRSD
jgi:hypothetical protein